MTSSTLLFLHLPFFLFTLLESWLTGQKIAVPVASLPVYFAYISHDVFDVCVFTLEVIPGLFVFCLPSNPFPVHFLYSSLTVIARKLHSWDSFQTTFSVYCEWETQRTSLVNAIFVSMFLPSLPSVISSETELRVSVVRNRKFKGKKEDAIEDASLWDRQKEPSFSPSQVHVVTFNLQCPPRVSLQLTAKALPSVVMYDFWSSTFPDSFRVKR